MSNFSVSELERLEGEILEEDDEDKVIVQVVHVPGWVCVVNHDKMYNSKLQEYSATFWWHKPASIFRKINSSLAILGGLLFWREKSYVWKFFLPFLSFERDSFFHVKIIHGQTS